MPTRDEIKPRVIGAIKAVTTGEDDLVEKEESDLQRDLGMGAIVKEGLAVSYSKITKSYKTGIGVSISDSGDCKTVKDSIDLVFKRSNGLTKGARKKLKVRLLSLLIAAPLVMTAFGEEPTKQDSLIEKLIKFLRPSLRQSVLDRNAIEKPAVLQFVHPSNSNKGNSYSIDVGLTLKLLGTVDKAGWQVGPIVEYHRQTETPKQQNNIQVGLTGICFLGDVAKVLTLYTQATLKYKSDRIATGEGLLAKIDFMPLKPAWGIGSDFGLKQLRFLWQPTLGIQYETASNVLKTGQSGEVERFYGNMEMAIYPLARTLRRNLELVIQDSYWLNINRTGGFSSEYSKDHNLFQVSLTIYFDDARHFGVGIDYFNGENPEQGLLKQKATIVAFKTKF